MSEHHHLWLGAAMLLLAACSLASESGTTTPVSIATPAFEPNEDRLGCAVGPVPDRLQADPFYSKYCDADGIPMLSSAEVEDRALRQAYYIVSNMLASIPYVRAELAANHAYVVVIGAWEDLTSLPEYSALDSDYWNQRARALGGTRQKPVTSAPEENLVCARRDRYYGESILVHEFAHTIHLAGLGGGYDTFTSDLMDLYDAAIAQDLWEKTYAGSSVEEYWAEGVQTYFNTNLASNPPDGVHNQIDTRTELAEYDPGLYQFMDRFFGGFSWEPKCPSGNLQ